MAQDIKVQYALEMIQNHNLRVSEIDLKLSNGELKKYCTILLQSHHTGDLKSYVENLLKKIVSITTFQELSNSIFSIKSKNEVVDYFPYITELAKISGNVNSDKRREIMNNIKIEFIELINTCFQEIIDAEVNVQKKRLADLEENGKQNEIKIDQTKNAIHTLKQKNESQEFQRILIESLSSHDILKDQLLQFLILNASNFHSLMSTLENSKHKNLFLEILNFQTQHLLLSEGSYYKNLKTMINKVFQSSSVEINSNDNTILDIKGNNIVISEVLSKISSNLKNQQIQDIRIFAEGTLYLDCNFTCPGKNLILMGAKIVVDAEDGEQIRISTSGKDAIQLSQDHVKNGEKKRVHASVPAGDSGDDGKDGDDGEDAGNVYIEAREYKNLEKLIIRANGGKGADGLNGGIGDFGTTGKDGEDQYIDDVSSLFTKGCIIKDGGKGIKPGPGGNGGKGGLGGRGGCKGEIIVKNKSGNVVISEKNKRQSSGSSGKDADGGAGGNGGEGGREGVGAGLAWNGRLFYKNPISKRGKLKKLKNKHWFWGKVYDIEVLQTEDEIKRSAPKAKKGQEGKKNKHSKRAEKTNQKILRISNLCEEFSAIRENILKNKTENKSDQLSFLEENLEKLASKKDILENKNNELKKIIVNLGDIKNQIQIACEEAIKQTITMQNSVQSTHQILSDHIKENSLKFKKEYQRASKNKNYSQYTYFLKNKIALNSFVETKEMQKNNLLNNFKGKLSDEILEILEESLESIERALGNNFYTFETIEKSVLNYYKICENLCIRNSSKKISDENTKAILKNMIDIFDTAMYYQQEKFPEEISKLFQSIENNNENLLDLIYTFSVNDYKLDELRNIDRIITNLSQQTDNELSQASNLVLNCVNRINYEKIIQLYVNKIHTLAKLKSVDSSQLKSSIQNTLNEFYKIKNNIKFCSKPLSLFNYCDLFVRIYEKISSITDPNKNILQLNLAFMLELMEWKYNPDEKIVKIIKRNMKDVSFSEKINCLLDYINNEEFEEVLTLVRSSNIDKGSLESIQNKAYKNKMNNIKINLQKSNLEENNQVLNYINNIENILSSFELLSENNQQRKNLINILENKPIDKNNLKSLIEKTIEKITQINVAKYSTYYKLKEAILNYNQKNDFYNTMYLLKALTEYAKSDSKKFVENSFEILDKILYRLQILDLDIKQTDKIYHQIVYLKSICKININTDALFGKIDDLLAGLKISYLSNIKKITQKKHDDLLEFNCEFKIRKEELLKNISDVITKNEKSAEYDKGWCSILINLEIIHKEFILNSKLDKNDVTKYFKDLSNYMTSEKERFGFSIKNYLSNVDEEIIKSSKKYLVNKSINNTSDATLNTIQSKNQEINDELHQKINYINNYQSNQVSLLLSEISQFKEELQLKFNIQEFNFYLKRHELKEIDTLSVEELQKKDRVNFIQVYKYINSLIKLRIPDEISNANLTKVTEKFNKWIIDLKNHVSLNIKNDISEIGWLSLPSYITVLTELFIKNAHKLSNINTLSSIFSNLVEIHQYIFQNLVKNNTALNLSKSRITDLLFQVTMAKQKAFIQNKKIKSVAMTNQSLNKINELLFSLYDKYEALIEINKILQEIFDTEFNLDIDKYLDSKIEKYTNDVLNEFVDELPEEKTANGIFEYINKLAKFIIELPKNSNLTYNTPVNAMDNLVVKKSSLRFFNYLSKLTPASTELPSNFDFTFHLKSVFNALKIIDVESNQYLTLIGYIENLYILNEKYNNTNYEEIGLIEEYVKQKIYFSYHAKLSENEKIILKRIFDKIPVRQLHEFLIKNDETNNEFCKNKVFENFFDKNTLINNSHLILNSHEQYLFQFIIEQIKTDTEYKSLINIFEIVSPSDWSFYLEQFALNETYQNLLNLSGITDEYSSTIIKSLEIDNNILPEPYITALKKFIHTYEYNDKELEKILQELHSVTKLLTIEQKRNILLPIENLIKELNAFKHNFNRSLFFSKNKNYMPDWILFNKNLIGKLNQSDTFSEKVTENITFLNNVYYEVENLENLKLANDILIKYRPKNMLLKFLYDKLTTQINIFIHKAGLNDSELKKYSKELFSKIKFLNQNVQLLKILVTKVTKENNLVDTKSKIHPQEFIGIINILNENIITDELLNILKNKSILQWKSQLRGNQLYYALAILKPDNEALRKQCVTHLLKLESQTNAALVDSFINLLIKKPDFDYGKINYLLDKITHFVFVLDKEILVELKKNPINAWENILKTHTEIIQKKERDIEELVKLIKGDAFENDSEREQYLNHLKTNVKKIRTKIDLPFSKEICKEFNKKDNEDWELYIKNKKISEWNVNDIKEWRNYTRKNSSPEWISNNLFDVMAIISQAVKLVKTHYPRDTQFLAILLFYEAGFNGKGRLGQVSTGEGKTLITAMFAIIMAFMGRKVDIVTSSPVLAQEGEIENLELFKLLDLTVANNCDEVCKKNPKVRKERYQSHIVYGDVGSFQRDILLSEYLEEDILGNRLITDKKNSASPVLIVDEVDSMLLDKSSNVLYLSHEISDLRFLRALYFDIWLFVHSPDLSKDHSKAIDQVLQAMQKQISIGNILVPPHLNDFVQRRLSLWIENAFTAKNMQENDSYIISMGNDAGEAEKIVPMDKSTGVEQSQMQWSNGLHQFLQLKHLQKHNPESLKAIFMSNLSFFKRYEGSIYGMTGTLGSSADRDLLKKIYEVDFFQLPRYRPHRFIEEHGVVKNSHESWLAEIKSEVSNNTQKESHPHRALLIICENVATVKELQKYLKDSLNRDDIYIYDTSFKELPIGKSKNNPVKPGDIIIATNIAGRGTDLITSDDLEKNGGLHVVLSYFPSSVRVEEQAFGRTARQGNCGSGKFVIFDEDKNITIDYLKQEREDAEQNKMEEMRLHELQTKIVEEKLFMKFLKLYKKISEGWEKEKGLYGEGYIDLQMKSLKDQWAFWLDGMAENIKAASANEEEVIFNAYKNFKTKMIEIKNKDDLFKFVDSTYEVQKMGIYFHKKKLNTFALQCFDEIIKNNPGFSSNAHYLTAFVLASTVNLTDINERKKVKNHLKQAKNLFYSEISSKTATSTSLEKVAITRQKSGEGLLSNQYKKQVENESEIIGKYINSIDEAIGADISSVFFSNIACVKDEKQAEKIYSALRDNSNILKDFRLSKKVFIKEGEIYVKQNGIEKKILLPYEFKFCQESLIEYIQKIKCNSHQSFTKRIITENAFENIVISKAAIWKLMLGHGILYKIEDGNTQKGLLKLSFDKNKKDFILPDVLEKYRMLIKNIIFNKLKNDISGEDIELEISLQDILFPYETNKDASRALWKGLINQNVIKPSQVNFSLSDAKNKTSIDNKLSDIKKKLSEELKTLYKNDGYDLFLMFKNEGGLPTLEELSKSNKMPILIKLAGKNGQKDTFHIYGRLENGKNQIVKLDITEELNKLVFDNNEKIHISPIKNSKIYEEITSKKGHTQDDHKNYIEPIYEILEHAIGKLKTLPDIKINLKRLEECFAQGIYPPELYDFQKILFDQVFSFDLKKPWWNWDVFAVAMMGVAQIIAGVLLTVFTTGIGSAIGTMLINEGIGDIMFAAQAGLTGNFSWEAYGIHKAVSLTISVLTMGIGCFLAPAAEVAERSAMTAFQAFRTVSAQVAKESLKAAGFGLAGYAIDKVFEQLPHEIIVHFGKDIRKQFNESQNVKQTVDTLKTTLKEIFKIIGDSTLARQHIDKVMANILNPKRGNSQDEIINQVINGIPELVLSATHQLIKNQCGDKAKMISQVLNFIFQSVKVIDKISDLIDLMPDKFNELNKHLQKDLQELKSKNKTTEMKQLSQEDNDFIDKFVESKKEELIKLMIRRMNEEIVKPHAVRLMHKAVNHLSDSVAAWIAPNDTQQIEKLMKLNEEAKLIETSNQETILANRSNNQENTSDSSTITSSDQIDANTKIANYGNKPYKDIASNLGNQELRFYTSSEGETYVEAAAPSQLVQRRTPGVSGGRGLAAGFGVGESMLPLPPDRGNPSFFTRVAPGVPPVSGGPGLAPGFGGPARAPFPRGVGFQPPLLPNDRSAPNRVPVVAPGPNVPLGPRIGNPPPFVPSVNPNLGMPVRPPFLPGFGNKLPFRPSVNPLPGGIPVRPNMPGIGNPLPFQPGFNPNPGVPIRPPFQPGFGNQLPFRPSVAPRFPGLPVRPPFTPGNGIPLPFQPKNNPNPRLPGRPPIMPNDGSALPVRPNVPPPGIPMSTVPGGRPSTPGERNSHQIPPDSREELGVSRVSRQNPHRVSVIRANSMHRYSTLHTVSTITTLTLKIVNAGIQLAAQERLECFNYQIEAIELQILINQLKAQRVLNETQQKVSNMNKDTIEQLLEMKIKDKNQKLELFEKGLKVALIKEFNQFSPDLKDMDDAFLFVETRVKAIEAMSFNIACGSNKLREILLDVIKLYKEKFPKTSKEKLVILDKLENNLNTIINPEIELEEQLKILKSASEITKHNNMNELQHLVSHNDVLSFLNPFIPKEIIMGSENPATNAPSNNPQVNNPQPNVCQPTMFPTNNPYVTSPMPMVPYGNPFMSNPWAMQPYVTVQPGTFQQQSWGMQPYQTQNRQHDILETVNTVTPSISSIITTSINASKDIKISGDKVEESKNYLEKSKNDRAAAEAKGKSDVEVTKIISEKELRKQRQKQKYNQPVTTATANKIQAEADKITAETDLLKAQAEAARKFGMFNHPHVPQQQNPGVNQNNYNQPGNNGPRQ